MNNTVRYAGGTITILIDGADTAGAFSLIEVAQRPGAEPPLHMHEREDETFYVLEGEMAVWAGGEVHHLRAGESIFLPRGVPHTFRVKTSVARGLNFISPAGFEEWFRALGTPADNLQLTENIQPLSDAERQKFQEWSARLNVKVLGPAPEF